MANRKALRELQTRLAERLQVARTQGVAASWLAVETGKQNYLFPLAQSGEIFPWGPLNPVPYTQAWFAGVANLRGGVFGVVDLASYVSGQPPTPKNELLRSDSRLISLNSALDVNCVLLVDRLVGLRKQDAFTDFSERAAGAPEYFGHRYTDVHGASWQEVNLQVLAQEAHFLTIGA